MPHLDSVHGVPLCAGEWTVVCAGRRSLQSCGEVSSLHTTPRPNDPTEQKVLGCVDHGLDIHIERERLGDVFYCREEETLDAKLRTRRDRYKHQTQPAWRSVHRDDEHSALWERRNLDL